jgi:hypothetical protein
MQDGTRRDRVFPGLAVYNFEEPDEEDWSGLVVERVNALLRDQALKPAARGLALFRAEALSPATIEALATGPFREPAVPYWGEIPQVRRP